MNPISETYSKILSFLSPVSVVTKSSLPPAPVSCVMYQSGHILINLCIFLLSVCTQSGLLARILSLMATSSAGPVTRWMTWGGRSFNLCRTIVLCTQLLEVG